MNNDKLVTALESANRTNRDLMKRAKGADYLLDRIANREEIEEADVMLARKLLS